MTNLLPGNTALGFCPEADLSADRNPALVYLGSLAPGSRRTMRGALQTVADLVSGGGFPFASFPWWRLRHEHVAKIRVELSERYSPATANKILTAVRQVLHQCRRFGLMGADDCANACDVKTVRGARLPKGRMISVPEMEALLGATRAGATVPGIDLRDRTMLMLLALAGLRRAEVARLRREDYDAARRALRVLGKGNKEREVPASLALGGELGRWLETRGDEPGPLLLRCTEAGVLIRGKGIDSQTIYATLAKLAARAGVADLSPHDFRRTFISNLLDHGHDIATVARLVGHENVQTTARYDRRGERAGREAVASIDLLISHGKEARP